MFNAKSKYAHGKGLRNTPIFCHYIYVGSNYKEILLNKTRKIIIYTQLLKKREN